MFRKRIPLRIHLRDDSRQLFSEFCFVDADSDHEIGLFQCQVPDVACYDCRSESHLDPGANLQ